MKRPYKKSEKWYAAQEEKKERMRQMNADPAFNPLSALTTEEREEYDILKYKGGYSREEALAMVLGTSAATESV